MENYKSDLPFLCKGALRQAGSPMLLLIPQSSCIRNRFPVKQDPEAGPAMVPSIRRRLAAYFKVPISSTVSQNKVLMFTVTALGILL